MFKMEGKGQYLSNRSSNFETAAVSKSGVVFWRQRADRERSNGMAVEYGPLSV